MQLEEQEMDCEGHISWKMGVRKSQNIQCIRITCNKHISSRPKYAEITSEPGKNGLLVADFPAWELNPVFSITNFYFAGQQARNVVTVTLTEITKKGKREQSSDLSNLVCPCPVPGRDVGCSARCSCSVRSSCDGQSTWSWYERFDTPEKC